MKKIKFIFGLGRGRIRSRLGRLLGLVFMAGGLSACASLSEKECLTVNWGDLGYRDGRQGHALSRIEDHRQACSKVGMTPNSEQYLAGREKGLLEYCTPASALHEGRLGRRYRHACPAQLESMFMAYHGLGLAVYTAQQQWDSLDRQVQQMQRSLDKEKEETKRKQLRVELRELERRSRRARDELRRAEQRVRF